MAWAPPEPKPENLEILKDFAYVLGWLIKGDGSVFITSGREKRFIVKFKCKNRSAVIRANRAFARVLGRYPNRLVRDGHFWVATYHAKAFVIWWKQHSPEGLKPYIEFSEDTIREFIRGYFDSDGSVGNYQIFLIGAEGHAHVLEYVRKLCLRLGIRASPIEVYRDAGKELWIVGKRTIAKERGLRFSVNAKDFLTIIGGFSHDVRDRKLRSMVKGRKWTPWSSREREQVLELISRGLTIREAARKVGVPYLTAYFWVKRGTRSWGEYSVIRRVRRRWRARGDSNPGPTG